MPRIKDTKGRINLGGNVPPEVETEAELAAQKGIANGLATLDGTAKLTAAQLPSSVVTGSGTSLLALDDTDLATQVAALPSGTRYTYNIVDSIGTWIDLGSGVR